MHWIYLIHDFHNLSWITEINKLFHDILIYWDAPVYAHPLQSLLLKSELVSWLTLQALCLVLSCKVVSLPMPSSQIELHWLSYESLVCPSLPLPVHWPMPSEFKVNIIKMHLCMKCMHNTPHVVCLSSAAAVWVCTSLWKKHCWITCNWVIWFSAKVPDMFSLCFNCQWKGH